MLTPGKYNPLVIEENKRVYLVINGWDAASETKLFTGLQDLPFDIVDAGAVKIRIRIRSLFQGLSPSSDYTLSSIHLHLGCYSGKDLLYTNQYWLQ
jgi:hypothetical protein